MRPIVTDVPWSVCVCWTSWWALQKRSNRSRCKLECKPSWGPQNPLMGRGTFGGRTRAHACPRSIYSTYSNLFGRWQQWGGLSLPVLQQLVIDINFVNHRLANRSHCCGNDSGIWILNTVWRYTTFRLTWLSQNQRPRLSPLGKTPAPRSVCRFGASL